MRINAVFRFADAQSDPGDSTVTGVCYPDSVLFHVRLRGLTEQQVEMLDDTAGFSCRSNDDGTSLVCVTFAHDVPSHPDTAALGQKLCLALTALVPDAEVIDVSGSPRFRSDRDSPAVASLHSLRRCVGRLPFSRDMEPDQLVEVLTVFAREFHQLDDMLCNGVSIPREWARRHPGGDRDAVEQVADALAVDPTAEGAAVTSQVAGRATGLSMVGV